MKTSISRLGAGVALAAMLAVFGGQAGAGAVPHPLFHGFVDQHGQPFTADRTEGKVMLVNFVFTQCSATCPAQMAELAAVQDDLPATLRDHVLFVSITVDPFNDTPADLRAFGELHEVDQSGWALLDAEVADHDRVVAQFGAMRPAEGGGPADPNNHTTEIYLFDTRHNLMQRYRGLEVNAARLLADVGAVWALRPGGRNAD